MRYSHARKESSAAVILQFYPDSDWLQHKHDHVHVLYTFRVVVYTVCNLCTLPKSHLLNLLHRNSPDQRAGEARVWCGRCFRLGQLQVVQSRDVGLVEEGQHAVEVKTYLLDAVAVV